MSDDKKSIEVPTEVQEVPDSEIARRLAGFPPRTRAQVLDGEPAKGVRGAQQRR